MISPCVKVVGCCTGRAGTIDSASQPGWGKLGFTPHLCKLLSAATAPGWWNRACTGIAYFGHWHCFRPNQHQQQPCCCDGVCRSSAVLGLCCLLLTQLSFKRRLGNWAECDRLSELQGESQPQGHSSQLRLLGTGTCHHTPGFSWMITDEFQVHSLLKQLLYFKLFLYSVWNY